ncbi:MAG: hypothetical protein UMU75_10210 [Halomonas sp.]|nr:hypothetical protein [Halomonas sp.]
MNKAQQMANSVRTRLGIGSLSRTDHTIATARRNAEDDGPMSVEQAANARREAEYVARRNGVKEPLLQLWKVVH